MQEYIPPTLEAPEGENKVLLHACCAPCSAAIVEAMLTNSIKPTVFYFNPNIYPREEYMKRKAESLRYTESMNLDFVDADTPHEEWLERVKGLEDQPERGLRCQTCFDLRMIKTAAYAASHGYKVFATTLASSRWKDISQIARSGLKAQFMFPSTIFWIYNWRKGGLSERRNELLAQYQFYNQQYCGCEFSIDSRKGNSAEESES